MILLFYMHIKISAYRFPIRRNSLDYADIFPLPVGSVKADLCISFFGQADVRIPEQNVPEIRNPAFSINRFVVIGGIKFPF